MGYSTIWLARGAGEKGVVYYTDTKEKPVEMGSRVVSGTSGDNPLHRIPHPVGVVYHLPPGISLRARPNLDQAPVDHRFGQMFILPWYARVDELIRFTD